MVGGKLLVQRTVVTLERELKDLGSAPLVFDNPVRDTVQLQWIHKLLPEESVKAGPGWGRSGISVCVRGFLGGGWQQCT